MTMSSSVMKYVKQFALIITAYYSFRSIIYLRKILKIWARRKQLALNLPHMPVPKDKQNHLLLGGPQRQLYPKDLITTYKDVPKYCLQIFEKNSRYHENDGLFMLFLHNPRMLPLPLGIILVNKIEIARELLSTKMLPMLKKGRSYEISECLIGNGVLRTSHDAWHRQRIILDRGFTEDLIKKQFPMIVETAKDLVNRFKFLEDQSSTSDFDVDLIDEMLKTTMDVLGRVAFSYDIGSLKFKNTHDAPLFDAFETILHGLTMRCTYPWKLALAKLSFLPENRHFNAALTKLDSIVMTIIEKRKNEIGDATNDGTARDLLDIMLNERNDHDEKLTIQQILDNMKTILFAGHDTTAAALSWAFYLLSINPDVVQKIQNEFQGKFNGIMSVENLEKSDYLNAVVLEVLRLYPSAGFTRVARKEIQVGEYLIPKGIEIFFFPYLLQRRSRYFKDPEDFNPDRWLGKDDEQIGLQAKFAKISRNQAYFPFSLGKRNCVGRKLALLEIRVVILHLLQNFDVKAAEQPESFQDWPYMGMTAVPRNVFARFKSKQAN